MITKNRNATESSQIIIHKQDSATILYQKYTKLLT